MKWFQISNAKPNQFKKKVTKSQLPKSEWDNPNENAWIYPKRNMKNKNVILAKRMHAIL